MVIYILYTTTAEYKIMNIKYIKHPFNFNRNNIRISKEEF